MEKVLLYVRADVGGYSSLRDVSITLNGEWFLVGL